MKDAFLVGGVRTAIGNFGGTLSPVRADDLAAHVLKALLERHPNLNPSAIEDVYFGCANQAGEDNRNVARMALLLAGYPISVGGETVNRLCASGMASAVTAARVLQTGSADIMVAGGVEHMTRGPLVIGKATSAYGRDQQMYDSSFGWRFINPKMAEMYGVDAMGNTAENLAELLNISREDQDKFSVWSQEKAVKAQTNGYLAQEIVAYEIQRKKQDPLIFDKDEFMRPGTSMDSLGGLKPAFKKEGSVTAGNASGLNDGACALLLASENGLKEQNLTPIARIVSAAVAGVEPRIMGIGPVDASKKALKLAGLTLDQMDVLELNEAFAAQVLACTRTLGIADNDPRINPNGGAIALGHPLGMSGARILMAAANELQRSNKKYALVTMCIGVGQGYATVIERV